jgi:hypothetical protein
MKREVDWSFINDLTPVLKLNKKYAKHIIEYYVDPEESWFLYVVDRVKKDRSMKYVSMIIRKDGSSWKRYQESQGWIAENEYEFLPLTSTHE